MNGPKVKILLADDLVESVPHRLSSQSCITLSNQPSLTSDQLPDALGDFDILVVRSTKVTAAAIESAKQLALIVRAGAGVNTIDLAAASAKGIQVANCPGSNAAAVAELAIGLLIAADRNIINGCVALRKGQWHKKRYGSAYGLKSRTLGILGFGAIGKAVAKAAQGLEMNVAAWSRSLTDEIARQHGITRVHSPLDLAACSDAVSIHLALSPETKHIVNRDFLSAMRDHAIFVNTSRGDVVDTAALKEATTTKKLRVGLDVYENEPAGGEGVFEDTQLAQIVSGTPHLGASTEQTSEAVGDAVIDIINRFVDAGFAPGAVNLRAKAKAPHQLIVRHVNQVGVLAIILEALREEKINVEEMDNTIFEGGVAAVCCLRLDRQPSTALKDYLCSQEPVHQVTIAGLQTSIG